MDDKTTPIDDSAEYQFTETEDAGGYQATPEITPELGDDSSAGLEVPEDVGETTEVASPFKIDFKGINWRRVGIPGGILTAIVVLYLVFTLFSSNKTSSSEQQRAMMQDTVATAQKQAMQTSTITSPSTIVSVPPVSIPATTSVSEDQMTELQNMMQQQVGNLQQQAGNAITTLNQSVSKTQQDLSAVTQQVEQITMAMQQVLFEIQELKKAGKPKVKKQTKLPAVYNVRAVVPGRAWLESADGKSTTVRVGDKLEGYGVVRVISPRQGAVIMSNGSIIQYGINDI